ncbi:MAG: xylose isomerase [Bacilli bacterium]|nr:xylose isomerase [Bacilli bacterium]
MKLAAQLYTVRQFLKTPADMARSLNKIKQMGYNSVQVSKIGPIEPAEFKKLADHEGLSICATHVDFSDMQSKLSEVIEKHQIWDCNYVGVSILPAEYRSSIILSMLNLMVRREWKSCCRNPIHLHFIF